jgi:preprotein translocase subunit YajC
VLVALALAQDSSDRTAGNPLVGLLPLVLLGVVFYLFLIRPQRARMREHSELMRSLRVGDEIETIGGIYGTIRGIQDETFSLEIAPGTTVQVSRGAVRRKVRQEDEEREQGSSGSP